MVSVQNILEMNNVYAGYGSGEILQGVSFSVQVNEKWAILGRNGTGKSTLIKLIAGILQTRRGTVFVNGQNILRYPSKKRARTMAYVPQKPDGIIPYSVHDFVMLGRYSLMGPLGVASREDRVAVSEAMDLCDIVHLQNRMMSTLSGGEFQRVLLASSVAQQTPILLLDEPTSSLDPAHERLFFDALSRIHQKRELTVIMITHDINTAMIHCTHVCALLNGKVAFKGSCEEFRNECPLILDKIFGVNFHEYVCKGEQTHAYGAWGLQCHL
ncbi:Iron(III) dicitrate transport ATP-binding protein FecE [Chitinispirillum alkaliphilum]|nr:Iron(III) dicitrate transport ATP-binding protein FecE [Chitinispirillum alkaliphilum]